MSRCRNCNLPEGIQDAVLNDRGICNYCEYLERRKRSVLDFTNRERILSAKLGAVRGKYKYDAVVGLSGGKDSTYVLYQMVKRYGLRVLAVTLDNGFLTDYARESVNSTVKALGVEHLYYKPDWNAYRKFYRATVRKMGNPCTACAVGGYFLAIKACCENRVPFFVHGRTPYQMYRTFQKNSPDVFLKLMKLNLTGHSFWANILGYLALLREVPVKSIPGMLRKGGGGNRRAGGFSVHSYVYRRVNDFARQAVGRMADNPEEGREITDEFFVDSGKLTAEFTPEFLAYFLFEPYDEEKIKDFLEANLDWKRPADDQLLGHHDCALHDAAAYVHKRIHGHDILEPDVAVMVRFGAVSREGAAEMVSHNRPAAAGTEKSLKLLCSLCEMSRDELENILDSLNRAGEKKFGVMI